MSDRVKNDRINNNKQWHTTKFGNITVYYVSALNGGGMTYGQDFIPLVRKMFGKVNRICEFCSGPGFIGFSLLANDLCNSLCLVDINPMAIKACKKTIKENNLAQKVTTYVSDVFKNVPKTEKWDLIVCNPPHFDREFLDYSKDIIGVDPKWKFHQEFYKSVKQYLTKDGVIIFVENMAGSEPKIWKPMITKAGLTYKETIFYNPSLLQRVSRSLQELYYAYGFNLGQYITLFRKNELAKKTKGWILSNPYQFYFVVSKARK